MIYSDLLDEIIQASAPNGVLGDIVESGKYGYTLWHGAIKTKTQSRIYNKQIGDYYTIGVHPYELLDTKARKYFSKKIAMVLQKFLLPQKSVCVVGLGNAFLVADSLGALVVKDLLVTHNLPSEYKQGMGDLCGIIPGVSGINGIDTFDIVYAVISKIKPAQVVLIDCLTAKDYKRLGCSFQISNTSITPGAGVGSKNKTLSKSTLNTQVVTIGVPLMINAQNLCECNNLPDIVLTPKEIDIMVKYCAKIISSAINTVVHSANFCDEV